MRAQDGARLLLLATIWGGSFLFIKVSLQGLSPLQVVAGRLVLGAGVLVVLLGVRALRLLGSGAPWGGLFVMAVVANIVPFLLISWGEERISSGLAAILNSTTPLFTAALAAVVVPGEPRGALRVAGIVLGFVGVAVIVGFDPDPGELLGQLAVVVASLAYAAGFVFARLRLTGRRHSALELSAGQLSLASAIALPLAGLDALGRPPVLTPPVIGSIAALGMLGTGIAYILLYRLVHDVGPTSASFVTYLVPVFGVVLGRLVLGERLGWNALAGAALVIAGIALAERRARRPAGVTA